MANLNTIRQKRRAKRNASLDLNVERNRWIELYLAVADVVDGGGDDADDSLREAYNELFNTEQGERIYTAACEEGSAWLT